MNVNYPVLLPISQSSIIHNVIEKHYLNPVLTEIQALSFPQGRHNWIPPEATDEKCRAKGENWDDCCCFLYFVFPILTFYFGNPSLTSQVKSANKSNRGLSLDYVFEDPNYNYKKESLNCW